MTTQNVPLTPRKKRIRSFLQCVSLRGCRQISSSCCWKYNPKALQVTTSEVVLLRGQKTNGTYVVVVFWVVSSGSLSFRSSLEEHVLLFSRVGPIHVERIHIRWVTNGQPETNVVQTWLQKMSVNSAGLKAPKRRGLKYNNIASCKTGVIWALATYS